METTYGDRLHKPIAPSIEEFYQAIGETFQRSGNVVIPTFALERAQELLYVLRQGRERNRLPPAMQVFLDSPMAISATEIFERHPEGLRTGSRRIVPRRARPVQLCRASPHAGDRGVGGDQPDHRRRGDHGRLGHVHRRAHPPSPAAQSVAAGSLRDFRRLRRPGHARAADHRRREAGRDLRRNHRRARRRSTRSTASRPMRIRPNSSPGKRRPGRSAPSWSMAKRPRCASSPESSEAQESIFPRSATRSSSEASRRDRRRSGTQLESDAEQPGEAIDRWLCGPAIGEQRQIKRQQHGYRRGANQHLRRKRQSPRRPTQRHE